jgi:hypothetical protein
MGSAARNASTNRVRRHTVSMMAGAAWARQLHPDPSPGRCLPVHSPLIGVLNQFPFETAIVPQFQLPPISRSRVAATVQLMEVVTDAVAPNASHRKVDSICITVHPLHCGATQMAQHSVRTAVSFSPVLVAITCGPVRHCPWESNVVPYRQTTGTPEGLVLGPCERVESADPSDMIPTVRLLLSQKQVT